MSIHLLVISDLHVGSTVGLLAPEGATLDDGGTYLPNAAQKWLWEQYTQYRGEAKRRIKCSDQVIGVVNGDAVDRYERTTQLWSTNDVDIVRAATAVLKPLRDLCKDGFFVIRGTEVHTRPSGQLEEALAMALDTTRWPANSETRSLFYLSLLLNDYRFDFAHHGRTGRLAWTRMNAAGGAAVELTLEYLARGQQPPHVAIRSHTHLYSDSGDNYPVRMITTPGWQLQTAYGYRIAPGRLPDIGGLICTIDRTLDITCLRYKAQAVEAWKPDERNRVVGSSQPGITTYPDG